MAGQDADAPARGWLTPGERVRLAAIYGFIGVLHALGWSLFLYYASRYPSLLGLGLAAYLFGLRHAFDADHIAAIDDTVRYMLQNGKKPLAIGFFFSLGHSSIVFGLAAAIAVVATTVASELPQLQGLGGIISASVSGVFLWLIGILNLLVLLDILTAWRETRAGRHDHAHLETLLAGRGFMNRLFGGHLQKLINHSWQMYPLGLLFGVGFDTASEVGLLAMAGTASAGSLPVPAVLSLPILFAAGMMLMDTTDGVLMSRAYRWAFVNPLRKVFYNLTITSFSIVVALVIGTIELLQVLGAMLSLHGPLFGIVGRIELGSLGYVIVGLFLLAWGVSFGLWKFGRIQERYGEKAVIHAHEHGHDGGIRHSHRHFH